MSHEDGKQHPDQPLRVRFSRALPVYLLALPIVILVLTMQLAGKEAAEAVGVFAFFSIVAGLIFILKPKTHGVLPDDWSRAKIEEDKNGFTVSWYAQYRHEMSPANLPALWLIPV